MDGAGVGVGVVDGEGAGYLGDERGDKRSFDADRFEKFKVDMTAVEDEAGDGEDDLDVDAWVVVNGLGDDGEDDDDSDGSGAYTTVKISAAAVIPK